MRAGRPIAVETFDRSISADLTSEPSSSSTNRPYVIFIIHPSGFLTDHLGNGDGLVAWSFIAELATRGHELHVAYERADIAATLPPNLHLYAIPMSRRNGFVRRIEYAIGVRKLYERLRAHGVAFDVMQQMNAVFLGLSLGMIGARTPLILGTYVPRWPGHGYHRNPIVRFARRRVVDAVAHLQQRFATALILTSPAALERIDASSRTRAKVRYVEHGVPTSLVEAAVTNDGESPEILFVGSLQEKKGVFVLLEAFDRVASRLDRVRLRFVGDGSDAAALHERAAASPAADRIAFTGAVPRAAVPRYMLDCDIFCLPSFGEPYATVVIEAMACSKPVVAARSVGLETLVSGGGARFVPQRDAAALAEALYELSVSAPLRDAMGAENRAVVRNRFTIERVVDKLESVYAEARS